MNNILFLIIVFALLCIIWIVRRARTISNNKRLKHARALTRAKVTQQADKDLIERFKKSEFVAAPFVPKPKRVYDTDPNPFKFRLRVKRGRKVYYKKAYLNFVPFDSETSFGFSSYFLPTSNGK